jgi:cell division protein FtsL
MGQSPTWDQIVALVTSLGVVKGLFVIFFISAHGVIFATYNGRLRDRQKDIDRLAAENKEHRERFTALIDKKLHVPKHLLPPTQKKIAKRRKK